MIELDKVRLQAVKFLRGRYKLDEVAGRFYDADCIRFRQGKRTIFSIILRPDSYDFQIILGKAEREKFEAQRDSFSKGINELYDASKTYPDGKWLLVPVADLQALEEAKRLILLKKNPNRKPFSKDGEVCGKCGHRCDMCVHYTGISEDFRAMLIPHLTNVYGITDWSMRCTGCDTPGCQCYASGAEVCPPLKCIQAKGLSACQSCGGYPCEDATVGYRALEAKSITADDVTWAILPYVPFQYEK